MHDAESRNPVVPCLLDKHPGRGLERFAKATDALLAAAPEATAGQVAAPWPGSSVR